MTAKPSSDPLPNPRIPRAPWPLTLHWALALLIIALWAVASIALDQPVYFALKNHHFEQTDFLKLLRITGILPTWLLVSLALLLIDRAHKPKLTSRALFFRSTFLLAATIASGLLGELVKLLVRRERPEVLDGQYSFRPFTTDFWSTSNLGLPSTHAIVAFAAAWALYRLHPAGWPVYFALAVGCAATRLIEHAHFLSDVYAACAISYLVVRLLTLLWVDPDSQPQSTRQSP